MSITALFIAALLTTGITVFWPGTKETRKKDPRLFLFTFLTAFIQAAVLGQFIRAFATDPGIAQGALIGGIASLGLIIPSIAVIFLSEKKTLSQLLPIAARLTVTVAMMGAIIARFS